ncbi:MAG: fasciclin domain-containing protein [Methanothrix sp.]|nr:fasciclin domain-containing protein [Methanothrix sp.]
MRKAEQFLLLGILFLCVIGCNDDFENTKYKRPPWLAGKLFTQIKGQPELSTFARCIELTGYDSIINISGSYTVFAPDNDAFNLYFQSHPEYGTVDDIPLSELSRIVKYHIVQNPWSTEQLKSLDIYGWIDSTDLANDKPRGYKRETLLRDKDRNYGVDENEEEQLIIVDTLKSSWYRKQATDSRKYAPIFFQDYFDIYDLNASDYTFYFDRPFESNSMYFVGAKIIRANISAENGFIHIIDRVVEPLKNAFQLLNDPDDNQDYSEFLNLINTFPEFTYDEEKTYDQPGADLGYEVDSLFDITYPELTFDITNERTKAPSGTLGLPGNVSIRYHHGLIAPTNSAFDEFVGEYLTGPTKWGSLKQAPYNIRRMIVNTHMANGPLYPTDFTSGFYNGEEDLIKLDQASAIQKAYGSNCTFVGVNKVLVPRAFSSVTGPVYLERGYSRVMNAIEQAGLLQALKRPDKNYMLFVESDANLKIDSSFIYYPNTGRFSAFFVSEFSATEIPLTTNDLRILIMNHIGTELPNGTARKEFIKNLAGNFIVVNNVTGEVSGTAPTTFGYMGLQQTHVYPDQISTNADNGKTYDIQNWFNFAAPTLYLKISGTYPTFHNLLRRAGLSLDREYRYSFISENDEYTVFIPSDSALNAYQVDTLTNSELRNFLLMHFIQGNMIFTDGHQGAGFYETARVDEKSTPYATVYTKIRIEPGIDEIAIPAKDGTDYLTVTESNKTNIIAGRDIGAGTEAYPAILSNSVIHLINKVLIFKDVDTQ